MIRALFCNKRKTSHPENPSSNLTGPVADLYPLEQYSYTATYSFLKFDSKKGQQFFLQLQQERPAVFPTTPLVVR